MKNMKKLTCQVLAACALTTGMMLPGTAFAETKEVSNQSVTASGDHDADHPVYGGNVLLVTDASGNVGIANGNTLTIDGGSFYQPTLASGNVKIGEFVDKDSPLNKLYTGSGHADNNTLTINAGTFTGSLYGGHVNIVGYAASNAAAANGNTVTILTAENIRGAVSGGDVKIKGGTAQADGNTVTINGGTFISQSSSDISGGYASSVGDDDLGVTGGSAQANGNSVEISGITITVNDTGMGDKDKYLTRSIYGGYATSGSGSSAVANNNSVTINGGNIQLFPEGVDGYSASNIYAGYATNGKTSTASNNTLTINGGNITCYPEVGFCYTTIGGGYANEGAIGNKVIISGGTFGDATNNVYVYGGNSRELAKGNEVKINGAGVEIHGNVFGGYSEEGTVEENRVVLSAGTVNGKVSGGSGKGTTIKGNEVIISGNTTVKDGIYGAWTNARSSTADGNKVVVTGGAEVTGDLHGAYIDQESSVVVKNNTVVITDGTVNGNVFGGGTWGEKGEIPDNTVSNNTVVLGAVADSGTATVNGNVYVNYIRYSDEAPSYVEACPGGGNLNVYNTGNTVSKNVYAEAANINFFVKAGETEGTARLNVTETANLNNANIKVNVSQQLGAVIDGKEYNLFNAGTINGTPASATITDDLIDSRTSLNSDGKVALNHTNDRANENSKSPVETQIVGVALVNGVIDMMANQGFSEAAEAINNSGDGGRSMSPYATVGGSVMRQNSGSYVEMNTWNIGVGFAKEVANSRGKLMFGPVFEYGKGSYDSYLDNGTHGSGDSSFWGVGAMIKQENKDGLYYEGSLRAGRLKNDYESRLSGGASYDNSAAFYALHAGVGKVVKLNEDDTLDYYGKLFYTHQNGSSATLTSGHIYDFDAINSFRTHLGLRYTHKMNKNQDVYAGLAWQHEFGSTANATFHSGPYSFSAPAPSVKGETGIIELGMKVKRSNGKFESDFGFIGSIGKQRGMGFNAKIQWNF